MRDQGRSLKIFHGNKVIEVLPQVAWTKGECAQWIQERLRPSLPGPVLWLYLGDDWTDEHAFAVLSDVALTIRVGDAVPASKAAYRLQDVSEVHQLLALLADGVTAESRA
jgi:trehalose-phosphatase